ncbi:NAD-dependent epimerase/dehydratase family protein [Tessaracoccus oleiagri]|uniref:Nucleoside-diphosphate-sugar epimerase n=1 Tax=Tessaracoccus oleiagri TaxID=686624 RepID=A0A1G9KFP8_9ACTN|nr:NAD-dependent epimerase/dehydratase family protein [Tessaracoccus oleiagri]SDL48406.1 Nucleoside-diphosphate-sugar epimerase [Tessaracoccus oleiagri]
MRIMVTGANGFVGQHIVSGLSLNHRVLALTRDLGHSFPSGVEIRRSPDLSSDSYWGDMLNDVEVVVHCAARVHVMRDRSLDPLEEYREVNLRGTKSLAQASADRGVRRFVFLSSIKVHGEKTSDVALTAADTPNPVDPYGISKLEAEQALTEISHQTGMETIIIRPTVIYGSGVKGNIRRMLSLIDTGLPLPFRGLDNRRSMLSAANLVEWVRSAVEGSVVPTTPLLAADTTPISTTKLVEKLASGMGRPSLQFVVPTAILRGVAAAIGQRAAIERLVENFEVQPTVEAFPGIAARLEPSETALEAVGRAWRASRR